MTTYSAKALGAGVGELSSFMPSKCISIALYLFLSTSSTVFPVATHPVIQEHMLNSFICFFYNNKKLIHNTHDEL